MKESWRFYMSKRRVLLSALGAFVALPIAYGAIPGVIRADTKEEMAACLAGESTASMTAGLAGESTASVTADTPAEEDIAINKQNFPDEIFRSYIQLNFDSDSNEKLSQEEIESITEIDVAGFGIKNLKGVEHLVCLAILDCSCNELTTLDLSNNINLYSVDCYSNKLTELNVKNCTNLEFLSCDQNYLKSLNVKDAKKLSTLTCSVNDLDILTLSNNPVLQHLHCGTIDFVHADSEWGSSNYNVRETNNHLTNLGLTYNTELVSLNCYGNQISSMSVKNFQNLKELNCANNYMRNLNVQYTPSLETLICYSNNLSGLNLSSSKKLRELVCYDNKIGSIDVSSCSELEYLNASSNVLKKLVIGDSSAMQTLSLSGNSLWKLDLGTQPDLTYLDLGDNKLKAIDVSGCPALEVLSLSGNPIGVLDLTGNTELQWFFASTTKLRGIDLSNNTKLTDIRLSRNSFVNLDISMLSELEHFEASENKFSEIDFSHCPKLNWIDLANNKIGKIDLTHNPELQYLCLDDNNVSHLNLFECNNLTSILASKCTIDYMTLPGNATKLETLIASENNMQTLETSTAPNLECLKIDGNKLRDLDLAKNTKLRSLLTHGNEMTELDISKSPDLVSRLKKTGVKKDTKYGYYYAVSNEEGWEDLYFTVDTNVDLKGYPLPKNPTPTPKPSDDVTFEDFVERLYTVALNRASEPEGKNFWVKQVVEEGKTGADCARYFLLDAPEFMNRKLSIEDFVETLYKTFFDRASDAAGKKGWVDAIRSGKKTRTVVVNDFIESTEWCDVCATYGVKSGAKYHKATKASKNAINFATRLYTCCLKRDAEEGGLKYWSLALTNLEKTGAQAAQFFFEGEEFVGLKTSNSEYINRLYTTFMDREPSDTEVDFWVGEIAAGRQTRKSILAFFAQSKEFTGICKKYGIDRGEIS